MEEASTDREVLSRLRNLKTSTQTQLARSQIDYYIHQIQRKHQKKAGHVVLYIILLFYLLFILYRTYLYLHPETYTIIYFLYIHSWYNSGTVCIWYLSFSCNSLELLCTELSVKKAKIVKTLQVISMAEPFQIQPLLSAISYAITSLCIFSSNQHTFF